MDKRRFLGVIVAASLTLLVPVLGGCGANKSDRYGRAETDYPGSYGFGRWELSSSRASGGGALSFTLDYKGNAVGQIMYDDGRLGDLQGRFDNSRRFTGSVTVNNETFEVWGVFSRQEVPSTDAEGKPVFATGLAGDFRQIVDGQEALGTFYAPGGNTITTTP
jgi:hypothetical protein